MLSRRKFTCVLVVSGVLNGCGRGVDAESIVIGDAAGSLNQTMAALMVQERMFQSLGLKAELLQVADGSKILGGVVSGSLDASLMSGFGQVFPAIERGGALKIIGGAIRSPILALFSAKHDIRTLHDLEGRTVGTGAVGALIHQLTTTLLRKFDVDLTKVRFANIGSSSDVFRAVSAGTVDAGVGPASFATRPAHGVHPIRNGDMTTELSEFTYAGAWTSDRAIAEKRPLLVSALAAYGKLYRFVQSPRAEQAFLHARKTVFPNAPEEDHRAEWTFVQERKPFATDIVLSEERLRYMQQVNLRFGIQSRELEYGRISDMSLAREAAALLDG